MAKSSYKSRESDSDEIKRKPSRRHRSKHESDSSYESDSDDHKSGRRHRSDKSRKSSGRHKKRRHSSPSSDSESEVSSGKSQSPRRKEPNEEEIVEYLAKKAYRKALKVAKKMKAPEVSGYSNDSNPFGDSNLTQKFVWKKKIEKDVAKDGVSSLKDLSVKAEKERQKRLMSEIEKVKKRREERALEKARREEEMAMLARERARAEFEDWEQKEEEFHFEQSKVRAEIRVNEGRAKPIDVLSKNLAAESFIEIAEPYEVFKGRSINEMLELRQDIKLHLELDRATPTHVEFWEAMLTVCDWEVSEARKRDALDRARVRGEEPAPELVAEDMGIHSSIAVDVEQRLGTMSFVELEKWQEKIESDMRTGSAKVVEYWEALLKRIHIFKAKARLREIHEGLRQKHLQQMQFSNSSEHQHKSIGLKVEHEEMLLEDPGLLSQIPEAGNAKEEEDNEAGSFSPELLHVHEGDEVVDPDLDKEELELRRARVLEEQQQRFQEAAGCSEDDSSKLTGQERALVLNAMGAMEEGDAILGSNSEVNLKAQIYWWHDKYRPRKPKYFNRVHTGYEWNKYNQTHYDHDNPPPKIVQGYKFNIFYPDLVDKSKTPTYYIERDGNSDETCMIRFHSGAPYEDIAFRIVNKEWEYSHKKGFKCTFERGILHLYFNFKRYRYRSTCLELASICEEIGLPAGVLNVVTGLGPAAGAPLASHPDIAKLAFTGSSATGQKIMSAAAENVKPVTLELGGKSSIIVFDDADIDKAVEWTMFGAFWTNDQICSATSRLLVQETIAAEFTNRLVEWTKSIKVSNPLEEDCRLGPIVSEGQYKKVLKHIAQAQAEGATLLCGGRRPRNLEKGYFVEATVLGNVTPQMQIWKEEVFGPVLTVTPFKTEDEAIQLANDSQYGLAGAVISKDNERCKRVSEALQAGIVWINCSQPVFVQAPWGGSKRSGFGRELGKWGLENYLNVKQVTKYISEDAWGWYPAPSRM